MNKPISKHMIARVRWDIAAINTEEIIKGLNSLPTDNRTAAATKFAEFYPAIAQAIARNVLQKDILSFLSSKGLKLHPAKFKAMLEAEAKQHNALGDRIRCSMCNSVLAPPPEIDATKGMSSPDANQQMIGSDL